MGVSQLFDPMIEECPGTGTFVPGEIFWVPTCEAQFKVVECIRATPHAHQQVDFQLSEFDSKRHYRVKDHLPIKLLHLDEHSEALLFKSKLRPCILLGSGCVEDLHTVQDAQQRRVARALARRCYLVAPLYSAASPVKPNSSFTTILAARTKALQYPHLAWLPEIDGSKGAGSIARLDRLFASELAVGVHRERKKISDDVRDLILAQMCVVLGIPMDASAAEFLRATKDLVATCLPVELA